MLVAALGLAPPTLLAAFTGGLVAMTLLRIAPRRIRLFTGQLARMTCLGFDPVTVCLGLFTTLVAGVAICAYLAVNQDQPIIAAAFGVVIYMGVSWSLAFMIQRRERTLRNQLADLAAVMSGATRANMSPPAALDHALRESSMPLTGLMTRVVDDYERNIDLPRSLTALGARLDLDALNLFTTAVSVTLDLGGRLEVALERIAESIRDQQRLEDKLEALTANGRNALVLLAMFPFAFAGFFYFIDPTGFDLVLASTYGQIGVGLGLGLVYLSVRWGKAILDRVGA
ncbi:MAG: type II secretion system F family protein [Planctomycetota bacterium]